MSDGPLVLMDQPEDGLCEALGWVEATVPEDEARSLLAPYTMDENDNEGLRPAGEAKRVWLAVTEPPKYVENERWETVEPTYPGAREFFQFDATDLEAPRPSTTGDST